MFTDIELFKEERQKFYDKLRELNENDVPDKEVRVRELNVKFRDDIRKYLPTCLNIINTNYNCHFSIYKVGNDYDSSFNVIETNVKKTRGEIECELTNYRSLLNTNALTDAEKEKLALATEIILTYVDDPTEDNEEKSYLSKLHPKASSIIENKPRMSQEELQKKDDKPEIQYNPYANQPINFEEKNVQEDNNNSLNIFASKLSYGNDANEGNDGKMSMDNLLSPGVSSPLPPMDNSPETGNMGTFFDTSIFNQTKDNNIPSPDSGAMEDLTKTANDSRQGMDLGMVTNNGIEVNQKKDINDLLAPMSNK